MIKIQKDKFGPDIRYVNGTNTGKLTWRVAEEKLYHDLRNDPNCLNNGNYDWPGLHRYRDYRKALELCQGPKCCFCEKPVHGGEIEHFRPKAAFQQEKGSPLERPGYFWLAYRWENFLISCGECNQRGRKGNRFPISGLRARARLDDLAAENCILIDPSKENPSVFISFNQDVPVGIDQDGRGNYNINFFELKDRGDIKSIRQDRFKLYKTQSLIANISIPGAVGSTEIASAKKFLKTATKSKQPFAGMIRENIKKGLL